MRHRPTDDEIESAIENIPDEWTVNDWNESNGSGDAARLTLELEYVPPSDRIDTPLGAVKRVVDMCDDGNGAPIDRVIDEAAEELDVERDGIRGQIEKLRTRGEVYEPEQGHLRAT